MAEMDLLSLSQGVRNGSVSLAEATSVVTGSFLPEPLIGTVIEALQRKMLVHAVNTSAGVLLMVGDSIRGSR